MTYVLYKVGKREGANDSMTRIMSHENVDVLREQANNFFADPENYVGRGNERLIIPLSQNQSNIVTTVAGGTEYHRYVEIRQIGAGGHDK